MRGQVVRQPRKQCAATAATSPCGREVPRLFLNSTIEVEIELSDAAAQSADLVQPLPDNTCARWRACLPAERTQTSHDPDLELLAALVVILHRSSLLPWDKFKAIMDTARYGYWDDDIEHRSYFIHFQAG